MRTLLVTLVLVPALALAQAPLPPPTDGASPPRPVRRLGKQVLPPPTAGGAAAAPSGAADAVIPAADAPIPPAPVPGAGPTGPTGASGRPTGRPFGGMRSTPPGGGPSVRRIPTVPPPPPAAPTAPSAGGEATITPADGRCVPLQGRFMLAFNKADIIDVLEQASRWTCRNFIYTEDIARGKITLLSKTPVTSEEAYAAFLAALSANNIVIYPTGKYYKLGRAPDSKKLPIPTYTDPDTGVPFTEQYVTKVIRLHSTDADMLRGVLGNFISPQGADIQSIPPDTLIITDTGINIRRIEKILDTVDRSGNADVIRVVQVRYAAAKDVADKLNQIFQAQGQGRKGIAAARTRGAVQPPPPPGAAQPQGQPQQGGADIISVSKVLADDRTNKLIIIADDRSFQRVQDLLDQLDVPTGADGGIHVVFLKNASAEELATTLSNLAQGQSKRQSAAPGAPNQGFRPPGAPGAAPPGAAPESTTAELFSGEVKVTADKAQNALLVQASGADFAAISRLIEKLDRARRQVFVEAVIMEVDITNAFQFGVSGHGIVDVNVNGKKGVLPLVSRPDKTQPSSLDISSIATLGGFLTGFQGPTSGVLKDLTGLSIPSLGVLVQALQSNSDVNVIATPTVLATDNQEAEITVNNKVPYQSGIISPSISNLLGSSSSTTAGSTVGSLLGSSGLAGLTSQIQHEDVQLRLKMKPQINEGGNVRLTLELEKDDLGSDQGNGLGPSFLKRTVKSDIVAKDQATIVIGGLIQETESRSVNKIPVLGSLPVLGALFRNTVTNKQKTNLLVFLTPYIIRDDGDYRRIFEKKQKELADFRAQFYGKRPGYTPDIDFSRKASPLSRIHLGVVEENSRAENGGPGLPGEGVTKPQQAPPPDNALPDRAPRGTSPGAPDSPPAAPAPPPPQAPPAEVAPPQPGEPAPE